MYLEQKYEQNNREYYCDLTKTLDRTCGFTNNYSRHRHYILDTRDLWSNCLAIRIPGRTAGSIEIDEKNAIVSIKLDTNLIGDKKQYPLNINQEMEQYVGAVLEIKLNNPNN